MRCTQQMVSMERKNRVTIHTKSGGLLWLSPSQARFALGHSLSVRAGR